MNKQLVNDAFTHTDTKTQEAKDYADTKINQAYCNIIDERITRFSNYDTNILDEYTYSGGNIYYDNSNNWIRFTGHDNGKAELKNRRRIANNKYSFKFRFGDDTGNNGDNIYLFFRWGWESDSDTNIYVYIKHYDNDTDDISIRIKNSSGNQEVSSLSYDFNSGQTYKFDLETYEGFVKLYIDDILLTENGNTNGYTNSTVLPYSWGRWNIETIFKNSDSTDHIFDIVEYLKVYQRIGG